jgi:hypothetical protein
MKPTSRRLLWWVILPPVAFVICVWISGASYDVGISPTGVQDIAGFVHRFGEPHTVHLVERDGQTYYEVIGGVYPRFTFVVPSNSPRYVFDGYGKFIEWCPGFGDHQAYAFDKRWRRSTNEPVPFLEFKHKLGL